MEFDKAIPFALPRREQYMRPSGQIYAEAVSQLKQAEFYGICGKRSAAEYTHGYDSKILMYKTVYCGFLIFASLEITHFESHSAQNTDNSYAPHEAISPNIKSTSRICTQKPNAEQIFPKY